MVKSKTIYRCQECGTGSPKWLGQCPECKGWSTFTEEEAPPRGSVSIRPSSSSVVTASAPEPEHSPQRISTGLPECDRCLGGGWTAGSLVLLGGDPGIGKSTLTLQLLLGLLQKNKEGKALYITGEESIHQVSERLQRVAVGSVDFKRFLLLPETCLENMDAAIREHQPRWVVVDSIQTSYGTRLETEAGSVSQLREVAMTGMRWAKQQGYSVLLVGHVTKEGAIAGPKLLEHMVDTVLYFEGENSTGLRLLRTIKNRFGPTSEVGVFEMTAQGLKECGDPSGIYLQAREARKPVTGAGICCIMEGSRAFLTEVQALVGATSYGLGRRTTSGVDSGRMAIVAAVLEKYLKIRLGDRDLFVSSVGGLRIQDPSSDLAIAAAILSSAQSRSVPPQTAFIGEVTLTGEIRASSWMDVRLQELKRLGFKRIFTGPLPRSEGKNPSSSHALHTINDLQSKLWGEESGRSKKDDVITPFSP